MIGFDERDGLESGTLHRSEAEIQQLNPHRVVDGQQGPEGKLVEVFEHLERARGAGRVDGGRGDGGIFGMAAGGVEIAG